MENCHQHINQIHPRQYSYHPQVLVDIAEDNELTVEKVRSIAKENGIFLSC